MFRQHPTDRDPGGGDRSNTPSPMSEPTPRKLLEFLNESTGDALRGVASHGGERIEPLYKRDDVDAGTFKRRITTTVAQAQHKAEDGDDAADHVELFDGVVVTYVRDGPATGTVVAIDSPIAGEILSFVDDCRAALTEGSGDTPARAGAPTD